MSPHLEKPMRDTRCNYNFLKTHDTLEHSVRTDVFSVDFLKQTMLNDIQFKGIIARAVGKPFEERHSISEDDLLSFVISSENVSSSELLERLRVLLLPIAKKGERWESVVSRRLRRSYMEKAEQLVNKVSALTSGMNLGEAFSIEGWKSFSSESRFAEFSEAGGFVLKTPRKRKSSPLSTSLFFQERYVRGKRRCVFGLLEARRAESPGGMEQVFRHLVSAQLENAPNLVMKLEHLCLGEANLIWGEVNEENIQFLHLGGGALLLVRTDGSWAVLSDGNDVYLGGLTQRVSSRNGVKIVPIIDISKMLCTQALGSVGMVLVLSESAFKTWNLNPPSALPSRPKEALEAVERIVREGSKKLGRKLQKQDPGVLIMTV